MQTAPARKAEPWELTEAEGRPTPPEPRECRAQLYSSAGDEPSHELVFPGPRMQLQVAITAPQRTYLLKGMFVVELSYLEDGTVFASHRELPVHGYGPDQKTALAAFCETFDVQYRHLVDVDESALTAGGRRRRQLMRDAVEHVEQS